MTKKKKVIGGLVGISMLSMIVGFSYVSQFEIKENKINVELGSSMSKDVKDYVQTNSYNLKATTLDTSKVDVNKVGTYELAVTFRDKKEKITVVVKDTVAPKVTLLEGEYKVIVGKEIALDKIIEKVTDLSKITSISAKENQIALKEPTIELGKINLKYDKVGSFETILVVEDAYKNVTEKKVSIKVIEDYIIHVAGMQDVVLEQGTTNYNFMTGITTDDKIAEVKIDVSKVDVNTAGEYVATYTILGNDKETELKKDIKVTVVTPVQAQEQANNGGTVQSSGGVKQPYVAPAPRSSGSSSNNSSSSNRSSSGSGSFSGSSNNGNSGGGNNKPSGGSGSGEIDPGGNTYESGDWEDTPSGWD